MTIKSVCENCLTDQGPFLKKYGIVVCVEKNVEACNKRRAKLDRQRWPLS